MSRDGIVTCVRVLRALLIADEELVESEARFLDRLLEGLALTPGEVAATKAPLALSEVPSAVKRLPYTLRRGQLEALVEGALADGRVDPRERAFVEHVAEVLEIGAEEQAWIWEKNQPRD